MVWYDESVEASEVAEEVAVRIDVDAEEEAEEDSCSDDDDEVFVEEPDEEESEDELVLTSFPLPQGMASPVGCLASGGSSSLPLGLAIPNLVVQAGFAPSLSVNW